MACKRLVEAAPQHFRVAGHWLNERYSVEAYWQREVVATNQLRSGRGLRAFTVEEVAWARECDDLGRSRKGGPQPAEPLDVAEGIMDLQFDLRIPNRRRARSKLTRARRASWELLDLGRTYKATLLPEDLSGRVVLLNWILTDLQAWEFRPLLAELQDWDWSARPGRADKDPARTGDWPNPAMSCASEGEEARWLELVKKALTAFADVAFGQHDRDQVEPVELPNALPASPAVPAGVLRVQVKQAQGAEGLVVLRMAGDGGEEQVHLKPCWKLALRAYLLAKYDYDFEFGGDLPDLDEIRLTKAVYQVVLELEREGAFRGWKKGKPYKVPKYTTLRSYINQATGRFSGLAPKKKPQAQLGGSIVRLEDVAMSRSDD